MVCYSDHHLNTELKVSYSEYRALINHTHMFCYQFSETLQRKLESTQEELMKMQIRYQKEIEKLEKQNKELKTQLLLKSGNQTLSSAKLRKIKVILHFLD